MVDWSLAAARSVASPGGVVLVVPADRLGDPEPAADVVAGGATRSASVRAGSWRCPRCRGVLVHDSARPLGDAALFARVAAAVAEAADAMVPAVPVTDLRAGDGGPVDRATCWRCRRRRASGRPR